MTSNFWVKKETAHNLPRIEIDMLLLVFWSSFNPKQAGLFGRFRSTIDRTAQAERSARFCLESSKIKISNFINSSSFFQVENRI